jgi:hypothetical protein
MTWAQALEGTSGERIHVALPASATRAVRDCFLEMSRYTGKTLQLRVYNASSGALQAKPADRTAFDEHCNSSARVRCVQNLDRTRSWRYPRLEQGYGHLNAFLEPRNNSDRALEEVFTIVKRDRQACPRTDSASIGCIARREHPVLPLSYTCARAAMVDQASRARRGLGGYLSSGLVVQAKLVPISHGTGRKSWWGGHRAFGRAIDRDSNPRCHAALTPLLWQRGAFIAGARTPSRRCQATDDGP